MAMTKLSNLVNPEVMADMINATLPKRIKFTKIAKVDTTLEGVAGNTITVPKYEYIGDAEDIAEGIAMDTAVLTTNTTQATVKKAGKAVEITDESVESGYGDPIGQAQAQLGLSIASKVDLDCANALLKSKVVYTSTGNIGYNGIVEAQSLFNSDVDDTLDQVLFINPAQEATIRKDADFIDKNKYGMDVIMNGVIGRIGNAQVVKSKNVPYVKYKTASSGLQIVATGGDDSTTVDLAKVKDYTFNEDTKELVVPKIGDYVQSVAQPYFLNSIVVVDSVDPNESTEADGYANEAPALTIYMKKNVVVESDRDILKKTTVISADEHYVAVLSNESKVVVAKFMA